MAGLFAVIALVVAAIAATAAQAAPLRPPLIYLRDIDASIRQDLRYAGSDNFTGRPLPGYGAPECMLRRAAALALKSVQAELAAADLSLKVYDCYRPRPRRCRHGGVVAQQRRSGYVAVLSGAGPRQVVRARLHRQPFGAFARRRGRSDIGAAQRGGGVRFDPNARYGPCTAVQAERAPDDSLDMGTRLRLLRHAKPYPRCVDYLGAGCQPPPARRRDAAARLHQLQTRMVAFLV